MIRGPTMTSHLMLSTFVMAVESRVRRGRRDIRGYSSSVRHRSHPNVYHISIRSLILLYIARSFITAERKCVVRRSEELVYVCSVCVCVCVGDVEPRS